MTTFARHIELIQKPKIKLENGLFKIEFNSTYCNPRWLQKAQMWTEYRNYWIRFNRFMTAKSVPFFNGPHECETVKAMFGE